ncbi:hypothetical protein BDW22DRAFT_1363769, partial [Trametopsis cervina]
ASLHLFSVRSHDSFHPTTAAVLPLFPTRNGQRSENNGSVCKIYVTAHHYV